MNRVVEFDLRNDLKLRVEETAVPARGDLANLTGQKMRGAPQQILESATQSFEGAIAQIGPAAEALVERLRLAAPSEIELEFGLKLEAKAGAIVTKVGGEAHFKISLKWKEKP